jgi:molecular chaperone DnaJ
MLKKDFYDVLELDRNADAAQVKKNYRRLAKKYHPDLNKNDAAASQKFKEVQEAYEVLSDESKRRMYDQFGHAGVNANQGGFGGGDPFGGANPFEGFGFGFGSGGRAQQVNPEEMFDLFEDMFGGGMGGSRRRDIHTQVTLSFMDAVRGVHRNIDIEYNVRDNHGRMRSQRKQVSVNIPPGIEEGVTIRVTGEGADIRGRKGDLYIEVNVAQDPYFKRKGQNIHTDVDIPLHVALLGGYVDVLTLDGMIEMKVPRGIKADATLLLRGKGVERRGDHFVHVKVKLPKKLTERQEQLIEAFAKEEVDKGDHHDSSISDSVAKAWHRLKHIFS